MTSRHAVIGLASFLWLAVLPAFGQEAANPPAPGAKAPDDGKARVSLDWDTFKKVTGFDEGAARGPRPITLPWSEVQDLLGVKIDKVSGAKVEVSWQEFKALLEWSLQQKPDAKKPEPPADFIVSSASYKGALTKDGAAFTMEMKIQVLKEKGWKRIAVLPAAVAVRKATLPEGAYLVAAPGAYEIVTDKAGEMTVTAEFSAAVTEQAGINRVSFPRVASATGVLDLEVDRKDVDVKVDRGQGLAKRTEGEKTLVLAGLPADAPVVSIAWERAIPEVEKVPPKVFSDLRTLVAVGDGVLIVRERVDLQVLHTAVRTQEFVVPEGVNVLEVAGDRVRDWRVKDAVLTVHFASEVLGGYALAVTFEKPAKGAAEAPLLRVKDAVREAGHIGIVALANVEISAPAATGATAIDVRELPPEILAMTSQPILLAFRHSGEGVKVPLTVKRHEDVSVLLTLVDSAVFTAMQTKDGRRITKVQYSVRNNRNQFLRLEMPEGADIWSALVNGQPTRPARDEKGKVLIPLVRSERGSSDLAAFPVEIVYVEKEAKEPPAKGKIRVTLPVCLEPVTHVMASLYLPAEGSYSGFKGPMKKVDAFTTLGTLPTAGPRAPVGNIEEAQKLAAQAQEQFDRQATAAGVAPIRVQLPIHGKPVLFEKILVLGEPLSLEFDYSFKKGFLGL